MMKISIALFSKKVNTMFCIAKGLAILKDAEETAANSLKKICYAGFE